jgi:hypothetical protein
MNLSLGKGASAKTDLPLVFVHYGKAAYLRQNLKSATRSNPKARIFLLGDHTNAGSARDTVEFLHFQTLMHGPEFRAFDGVFEPIQGERHRFNKLGGTKTWLRFVFLRWFCICEILRLEKIDRFWTFDSDTLALAPLAKRAKRFTDFEATTQCRDCCLNGFVGSKRLVERFTSCIVELFKDIHFLDFQRERLKQQAGLAFNEMDAFCEFRRRESVRTFHAAQPLEGEFFDDPLAYDANFEASLLKVAGHIQVKRLWSSPDGALYAKHLASGSFVRMITCNLSWLPDYVGKKLARYCLSPEQDAKVRPPVESELCEIDLSQPLTDKIATALKRKVFEVKRALGRRGR